MRTLPQDLRYALRTLGRAPVFSATVLITLTFGLGAATAILGLFDAVVLRPLPYTDPGKLVVLWESNPERGVITNEVSLGNFLDWCDRSRSFEHVTALTYRTLNLTSAVTLVSAWLPVRRAMRLDPSSRCANREPQGSSLTAARPGACEWYTRDSADSSVAGSDRHGCSRSENADTRSSGARPRRT